MKIDFKKLAKLEKEYRDNYVSMNSLQTMVDLVLHFNETSYKLAPNNIQLAITTLKELGILIDGASIDAQPLNS